MAKPKIINITKENLLEIFQRCWKEQCIYEGAKYNFPKELKEFILNIPNKELDLLSNTISENLYELIDQDYCDFGSFYMDEIYKLYDSIWNGPARKEKLLEEKKELEDKIQKIDDQLKGL